MPATRTTPGFAMPSLLPGLMLVARLVAPSRRFVLRMVGRVKLGLQQRGAILVPQQLTIIHAVAAADLGLGRSLLPMMR
jgi:hypothetical protein